MPGRDHFVAFDLGAESGRAVLGGLDGERLVLEEKHRFANPTGRMNGTFHWNLLGQWEELKLGLRKCAIEGGNRRAIESVGVDTWGVDFGLLAPNGDILGNPAHYRDRRTEGVMEKVFQRVSKQNIFEITGIQFMPLNTLYQLVALKASHSSLLAAAETMLFMPDLFNYLFTGKRQTEFSIATTSQMFNPRKRAWAEDLLAELELPRKILPTIVPSGSVVGPMRKDVAAECRVGAIPVIAPGTHDTASAVAAVPAHGDDWCYISSGTWSLMGVELNAPIINEKALRYEYTNEGGVAGKIRFLKNITGLWLVQECRRAFAQEGRDYEYGELAKLAEQAEPFRSVIDPDHTPFRSPGDIPKKIDRFCAATQQRPPTTPGEFVRTCLESLAITYRRTLAGLEDVLGKKIKTIHIVGGGSRNELLNQMTADACARTVIAGPSEATSIGNILVQAMAMGRVKSLDQARSIVRHSFDVKRYDPRDTKAWDMAYDRYLDVRQTH
jgi:rhamnulokinase